MASTDSSGHNKYRVGFNDCFTEMNRFLSSEKDIDVELRVRILNHLSNYLCERSRVSNCASSETGGPTQQSTCVSTGSSVQALLSGCMSAGTDIHDKVSIAPTKSTCAPETLLNSAPEIRPTFVQVVNSSTAPTILSSLASAPSSTNHDRRAGHVTTTMPPPMTISGEAEVSQLCQGNVLHSSQGLLNRMSGVISENNMIQNLHLLPTKLTSGSMTYVLPANVSVVSGGSIPSYVIPVFTSPELVSGSPIASHQSLSLATIATPPCPTTLIKEEESSSQFQSPSANTSAFVPKVKYVLPSQGFTPVTPGKSNTSSNIQFPIRDIQDSKPTTSPLSSVLHLPSVSDLPVPAPSGVIRAFPEVAQERVNMVEHDVMWRPW